MARRRISRILAGLCAISIMFISTYGEHLQAKAASTGAYTFSYPNNQFVNYTAGDTSTQISNNQAGTGGSRSTVWDDARLRNMTGDIYQFFPDPGDSTYPSIPDSDPFKANDDFIVHPSDTSVWPSRLNNDEMQAIIDRLDKGYITDQEQTRVNIDELIRRAGDRTSGRGIISDWWDAFMDYLNRPRIESITLTHPNSGIYDRSNVVGSGYKTDLKTFDGTPNSFKNGDTSYNSISEMLRGLNDAELNRALQLLRRILKATGLFNDAMIDAIIQALKIRIIIIRLVDRIQEGVRKINNSTTVVNVLFPGLLNDDFYKLFDLVHNYDFDVSNTPTFINGTDGGSNRATTQKIDPDKLREWFDQKAGQHTGYTPSSLDDIYKKINNSDNTRRIADDVIQGGLTDGTYLEDRIGLAKNALDAMATWGLDSVDISRVLDYRIKELKLNQSEQDIPTGKYMWKIEIRDPETGRFVETLNSPDTLAPNATFFFRPLAQGTYKITCYPEYKKATVDSASVFATEYTYLTDTKNVLTIEQNFWPNDTVTNMPGVMSDKQHKSYTETIESEATDPHWNWDSEPHYPTTYRLASQFVGGTSTVSATPTHLNEYAMSWIVNVTEDMVNQIIIDFNTGDYRSEFSTERIR